MVKLHCSCLNICINAQEDQLSTIDGKKFLSFVSNDEFFRGKVYEVQLAVAGIQKEVDLLMRERQVEDWTVFKCLGCNTEPFAFHSIKREDRVLVGENIQCDPKKIAELKEDRNYSPAFKIILERAVEEVESSVPGMSIESVTIAGTKVQNHIRRYLKQENDAMLERIRKYTEEENKRYTAIQARAGSDKRAMLSILRLAAENKVKERLSDAMADLETNSSLPDERPQRKSDFLDGAGEIRIINTPSISSSWNTKEKQGEIDNDHHLDPLFQTHDDDQPFVDSDEEESSDNSFNQTDMEYTRNETRYSSSVPVNVPSMGRSKPSVRDRSLNDDDCEEMPSPDKIAESIQALARSVRDSRDIFGELPRPRKNTLPVKFR